ncbi:GspH/FimT family pseudopilin [Dyella telluris]|uniref:Type II secretion system protein H n=1 Tax=Dyella telluris TaxID=2763498 RepID=A0A7G8Q134_9GAMM|nr:GspH/FimT family pseudopilin [Dyella telluris]QNK00492.1 GspH/FimT family pseudopilin [Dyella telluris]
MTTHNRRIESADRQASTRATRSRAQGGFTLIEMVIAIIVAGILLTIAIPSMRSFMQRDRVAAQANGLLADLQYARGQAVATHGYVSVCALSTASGTTCDTSDGNFGQGWMIFTTTTPGAAYSATGSTLLRVQEAPTTTSIAYSSNGILTYDTFGHLWVGSSSQSGASSFIICAYAAGASINTHLVPGSKLTISASGRTVTGPMSTTDTCSS